MECLKYLKTSFCVGHEKVENTIDEHNFYVNIYLTNGSFWHSLQIILKM